MNFKKARHKKRPRYSKISSKVHITKFKAFLHFIAAMQGFQRCHKNHAEEVSNFLLTYFGTDRFYSSTREQKIDNT